MQVITNIQALSPPKSPCGLTIGTFDGVHLGHRALFQSLRKAISPQGTLCALTFSNHPSDVFTHRPPTPLLTTLEHKLKLLAEEGVDIAIVLPFTAEFAKQSFTSFLSLLKQKLHFTQLTLGTGASFGKDRQGDETHIRALAQDFAVDYLPKVLIDGLPVSSGRIRAHLSKGEFASVATLLGRPYSLYGPPTQFHLPGLCLPPNGRYPVRLKLPAGEKSAQAVVDQKTATVTIETTEPIQNTASIEIVFS